MSKRKRTRKGKYQSVVDGLDGKAPKSRNTVSYAKGTTKHNTVELKLRSDPICFGFPMDELMFSKFFVNSITNLNIMPWDSLITTQSTYLPAARNLVHNSFLKETSTDWLVMVDSDVLVPPWFVDKLLKYDKSLVGGWYHHKDPESIGNEKIYQPVVYDYINTEDGINNYRRKHIPGKGLERVDGLGAGCLLMRRDLAEALGESPYDMNSGGEDLVLCKKVYDLGFDIHVDWDMSCAHIGVSYV